MRHGGGNAPVPACEKKKNMRVLVPSVGRHAGPTRKCFDRFLGGSLGSCSHALGMLAASTSAALMLV